MRALRSVLLALLVLSFPAQAAQPEREAPVRVFAAASLTDALNDVAAHWKRLNHPAPNLAFSATSALAKQIEAGAPADVFASADLK